MFTPLAQITLAALFVAAPVSVMPLLDKGARLDLIDLAEANMEAQAGNRFGGVTRMTHLSDTLISLQLTEVSTMDIRLLPDSTIEVTHCVKLPEHVNTVKHRYDTDWKKVE